MAGLAFGSRWETSHFFAALVVMQRDSVRAECVRKAQGAPCLGRWSSALESENLPYRLIFRTGTRHNCRSGTGKRDGSGKFRFLHRASAWQSNTPAKLAATALQEIHLGRRFHAFGDHRQAEDVRLGVRLGIVPIFMIETSVLQPCPNVLWRSG
jgi:hypothetical protein